MVIHMIGRGDIQQQRLTLLASILLWEGRLNNARLRELFGLSSVRASEWIREFREKHPSWIDWNSKTRSYYASLEAYRAGRNADLRKHGDAVSLSQYLALVGVPHAVSESSPSAPSGRHSQNCLFHLQEFLRSCRRQSVLVARFRLPIARCGRDGKRRALS